MDILENKILNNSFVLPTNIKLDQTLGASGQELIDKQPYYRFSLVTISFL